MVHAEAGVVRFGHGGPGVEGEAEGGGAVGAGRVLVRTHLVLHATEVPLGADAHGVAGSGSIASHITRVVVCHSISPLCVQVVVLIVAKVEGLDAALEASVKLEARLGRPLEIMHEKELRHGSVRSSSIL